MKERVERRGPERRQRGPFVAETVVATPSGRPWVVATIDVLYGLDPADPAFLEDTATLTGRYETQIHYTAREGIRGLPTEHGWHYQTLEEASRGHAAVCRAVEAGELDPEMPPAE